MGFVQIGAAGQLGREGAVLAVNECAPSLLATDEVTFSTKNPGKMKWHISPINSKEGASNGTRNALLLFTNLLLENRLWDVEEEK